MDEETYRKLQNISSQGLRDLKADLETALRNRVAFFSSVEAYTVAKLAMQ